MKWMWKEEKKWYHKFIKLKKFKYWTETEDMRFDIQSTHELKPNEADELFQLSLKHPIAKLKLTNCPNCNTLVTIHNGRAECCKEFRPKIIKKVDYTHKIKDQDWSVNTSIK